MARLQNNYATCPTDPLAALANPVTGAFIPNLPPDSASIARLNGNRLRPSLILYTPLTHISSNSN